MCCDASKICIFLKYFSYSQYQNDFFMCPVCQVSPQNENLIKTKEQKSDENAYLSECDSVSEAFVALFWDS